jgi:hypothetical protein
MAQTAALHKTLAAWRICEQHRALQAFLSLCYFNHPWLQHTTAGGQQQTYHSIHTARLNPP